MLVLSVISLCFLSGKVKTQWWTSVLVICWGPRVQKYQKEASQLEYLWRTVLSSSEKYTPTYWVFHKKKWTLVHQGCKWFQMGCCSQRNTEAPSLTTKSSKRLKYIILHNNIACLNALILNKYWLFCSLQMKDQFFIQCKLWIQIE